MRRGRWTGVCALCLLTLGCATPSRRFSDYARSQGFTTELVNTAYFRHRLFTNGQAGLGTLHVYLDGDGTPWIGRHRIAEDPTSRNPLILDLMKQDHAPSVLLGRPCYYHASDLDRCGNKWWTSHRYAQQIVDSMLEALDKWLAGKKVTRIVLIGFSGGGTLAMLMAPHIEYLARVVTIAGNLNVTAWAAWHGYTPLTGSLNPSDNIDGYRHIRQLHLAAGDDEAVPVALINAFAAAADARLIVYPDFNHTCCWETVWPEILDKISIDESP